MTKQNRWVLLEHDPLDDPIGKHFDLLLEDKDLCRSWRLKKNLVLNGPSQEAVPTAFHRLAWLSVKAGKVSGGRGSARRVIGGFFEGDLPTNYKEAIEIKLICNEFLATLEIKNCICRLRSS